MQDPTMDPRRVGALGTLLQRLNNLTKQIQIVETIPFDTVLLIKFGYKIEGFSPTIETAIVTIRELDGSQMTLNLIATKKNIETLGVSNKDTIPTLKIFTEWVQSWRPLKMDDLPLTLDYEVKYPVYNNLFQ